MKSQKLITINLSYISFRYLNKIVSSNQNTPVVQGESVVLGLSTCQAPEDQNSGIHFTHLKMRKNQDLPSFDVPPYVNFLKNGFSFGKDGAKIDSGKTSRFMSILSIWSITSI